MQFKDYLSLAKNRLMKDRCSSIYSIIVIAFSFLVSVVTTSLITSLVSVASHENLFFNIYTSFENNRIDTICLAVFLITIIVGIALVLGLVLRTTNSRKKEFKNKLMLGASYVNIILETIIENMFLYIVGALLGGGLSYLLLLVLGAILKITIVFSVYTFVVLLIIALAVVIIGSIVPVVWTTTSEE